MANLPYSLYPLSLSRSEPSPLDARDINAEDLLEYLHQMLLIRCVENKIAYGRSQGLIKGPVHLGVGQEAIPVGISKFLSPQDFVFGAHRSHAHLLALGSDMYGLFSEVLAKETGLSKGMGGSMHLIDQSVGFYGSVPIVAGTVSLAVGAAMASRIRGSNAVSVAYFGDGACEEGVIHESFNLAALNKEPIIFVVENNLFSSHMHISQRQPLESTSRFAVAHNIPHVTIDGNNVAEVASAAKKLIEKARQGEGPAFIEAVTYRWYGHVDWRDDVDVGVNRSSEDLRLWKEKDPIARLKKLLIQRSLLTHASYSTMNSNIAELVDIAWDRALSSSPPANDSITKYVFYK